MAKTGIFTPEEVLKILEISKRATRSKFLPLVMDIALNTGISRKNISRLTLGDFHEWSKNQYFIRVRFDEPFAGSNGKKFNEIPVESSFQARIFKQVARRNAELRLHGIILPENLLDLVILSNKGTRVTPAQISQVFSALLRKIFPLKEIEDRHLVFRSLRRMFAFYLLKVKELSLERVSKLLGHSSLAQTFEFLGVGGDALLVPPLLRPEQVPSEIPAETGGIPAGDRLHQIHAKELDRKREIDAEIIRINGSSYLSPRERAARRTQVRRLLEERDEITTLIPSARELELEETLRNLKRRYNDLLKELSSEERLKELGKLEKIYERKIEKQVKLQIKSRAQELHEQGLGYRKIAGIINEEYATNYHFTTMKTWLS